jgi:hypothetical protein
MTLQYWTVLEIKQMLERFGQRRPECFAVTDLTAGYWQAPILEEL